MVIHLEPNVQELPFKHSWQEITVDSVSGQSLRKRTFGATTSGEPHNGCVCLICNVPPTAGVSVSLLSLQAAIQTRFIWGTQKQLQLVTVMVVEFLCVFSQRIHDTS